jgi:hypothetical protein
MPAQILPKDERDDRMPAVLVPVELPAERACCEISHGEHQAIDMHVGAGAALLVFPDASLERRQMPVWPTPVALQGSRFMSHEPEGTKA